MIKKVVLGLVLIFCFQAQSISATKLIDFDVLTVNDFDLLGRGNTKRFLSIAGSAPAGTNGYIHVLIQKDGSTLFEGTTKLILNPNGIDFTFDNTEIKDGFVINDNAGKSIDVQMDGDAEFDKDVLGVGDRLGAKLPNGTYLITVRLLSEGTKTEMSKGLLTFRINTVGNVELSSPFDGETISNLPRFEWSSSFTYRGFELALHEALPGGGTNLDGKRIFYTDNLTSTEKFFDFNDPKNASLKGLLKDGKKYVWVVSGKYNTTSGQQLKNSALYKFTYKAQNTGSDVVLDAILQTILKDNYDGVKKEFEGMTHQTIKINDEVKTIQDLQQFINGLTLDGKIIVVETL